MNLPNFERLTIYSEDHETGKRFDLSDELSQSKDTVSWHPAGEVRFIKYPAPSERKLKIQRQLIKDGLLLGKKIRNQKGKQQVFNIPLSARPIEYDAPQSEVGEFAYGDSQLFGDLGRLLATASRAVDFKTTISSEHSDLGHLVAYKEFTKQHERRLYLVPGVENHFTEKQNIMFKEDLADVYADKLYMVFGERFRKNSDYFIAGFIDQVYEEDINQNEHLQ